jgi:hypothetical protein
MSFKKPPPPPKPAKPPKPIAESGQRTSDRIIESFRGIISTSHKQPSTNDEETIERSPSKAISEFDNKSKAAESEESSLSFKHESTTVNSSKTSNSIWNVVKSIPVSLALSDNKSTVTIFDDVQKSGKLLKMNREGEFDKNYFLLTKTLLIYFKPSLGFKIAEDVITTKRVEIPSNQSFKSMLLSATIVTFVYNCLDIIKYYNMSSF